MLLDAHAQVGFLEPDGTTPLLPGLSANELRQNSLLRADEQTMMDRTIVDVARGQLGMLNGLRSRGLTRSIGMGTLISTYQKQSDMKAASVSMSMAARPEADRLEFIKVGIPVPVISIEFSIELRELAASRQGQGGLDLSHVATATRKVLEKAEDIIFNGAAVQLEGYTLPGLLSFADRNTHGGSTWATVTNIFADVRTAIGKALADHHPGPFTLFVYVDQYLEMLSPMSVDNNTTVLERIKQLPGIADVQVSNTLTDGVAVLVEMTSETIDAVIAQDVISVPFETVPGVQHWRVLMIMAPRFKSDIDGKSGIVHITGI